MSKALVFGGSGFLGSYVADELTNRGFSVLLADKERSNFKNKKQDYVYCDIMDSDAVGKVVNGFDLVFNFAGMSHLDSCIDKPKQTMQQNVIANINVIENLLDRPIKRYVYASSVYAASKYGSFYGISKSTSESLIEEFSRRHNFPYTIVRYGSLYGERAGSENGVYRIIEEAINEKRITYSGDGDEIREYIHASDAAKLSVDVAEDDQYNKEIITLTGVEKLNRSDLVKMIEEIIGKEVNVEYSEATWDGHYTVTPYSFQPRRTKKLAPNPSIDLGQGIASCVESFYDSIGKYNDQK